jgi:PAS domain S-box-containing protein
MDSAATDRVPSDGTGSTEIALWLEWLSMQGEMGHRVATFAWDTTPLGPIEGWSMPLRDAVTLCLGSLLPMSVQWGPDLTVIHNDACRDLYGELRFATALGRATLEVWPETAAHVNEHVLATMRDGTPFFAVDQMLPLNRSVPLEESYFTTSSAPIIEQGVPVGVFSAFIETTAEVLAARRTRTLAALGGDLKESASELEVAAAMMDILSTNVRDHVGGALYAADADENGPRLATFGEVEMFAEQVTLVADCLASGQVQVRLAGQGTWHAYPLRDPEDGRVTHVLLLGQPSSLPADEVLSAYYALVADAIGAALLSHGEFVAQRTRVSEMAALDRAKSAFFAGVSHELRTPLALISAPVQDVLERDQGLSETTRRALTLAQSNVSRLTRMVEAMLDFSRMEAGRLVPHVEQADAAAQTRALAADFAPAFARAGLEFVVDVPELTTTPLLDRDFLERIVSNLLSNALKFTPNGRVTLTLAQDDDDHYAIVVTDTGIGVALEDLDRIFARFERLPPQPGARSSSGAGIGLAMVRQLTRLLDGEVTVESAMGRGTTFTVRLPFQPSRPVGVAGQSVTPRRVTSFLAEIDTWMEPDRPRVTSAHAPIARLVVAEDDPELARFLADCLSDDYEVVLVRDGVAALDELRGGDVDLLLTDLAMPGMDGLELVRQVRAEVTLREIPVVMLSASGDASASGLALGADDFVTKPFTVNDLRDRLAANLARAKERSADAAWRRAVMHALRDPLLIFDRDGNVVELNEAFTDLFGYTMADGPFTPPYPWWPTEDEDPEALAAIEHLLEGILRSDDVEAETVMYTADRRSVWVHTSGTSVEQPRKGLSARIRVLRDITRDKQARDRRAAAARVSADFARIDDLATLLGVAEHGFELLFDGGSTIQVTTDRPYLFASGKDVGPQDLHDEVASGLAGEPSADTTSLRTGILLVPQTGGTGARAWVQFPRPRRISLDEMIAADLLAQAFGLAVDRVVALQRSADKQANLQTAVESHRLIGQAVGILVERHKILPGQAFDRLKQASQNRNLKLREVASRVIETGAEPENV